MSRPPRIPVLLPEDRPLIYFLTFCTHARAPLLANSVFFKEVLLATNGLDRWRLWAIMVMPDHLYILVSPPKREVSVSVYSKLIKVELKKTLPFSVKWQEGCFDHLLRSHESGMQKWEYMRENPVRAGLVEKWQDWPYQKGFYEL